ncbi:MAG TPA: hypothetical protein VN836_12110 [Verrucomicrobiae bacterium]|nr:hypothetical protein [Verrucomicrobiae bacterium]
MGEEILIGGDTLAAIYEALKLSAPELCCCIEKILDRPPLTKGIPLRQGESVYHQYSGSMPLQEAEAILAVLVKIEKAYGYSFKFSIGHGGDERQINWLVLVWRQHVEQLRLRRDRP